jgi:hypothetical protein
VKALKTADARGILEFDRKVAVLLHRELKLSPVAAANPAFWAYFGPRYAPEGIKFRWKVKTVAEAPVMRVSGKWKDTYRRLWLRAEVCRIPGAKAPYALVRFGGEDFWVGVTERAFARCPALVKALVTTFFNSGSGNAAMKDHRGALKWLIEVQPVRAFELLSDAQAIAVAAES